MASDARGDTASGSAVLAATVFQATPRKPLAAIPAPHKAPVNACVVETGSPVRVAISSQPMAPQATAKANEGAATGLLRISFPENAATSACVATMATSAPATVQVVPQITAVRRFETPEPTSVAIPLETSFAPFVNARKSVSRLNAASISST